MRTKSSHNLNSSPTAKLNLAVLAVLVVILPALLTATVKSISAPSRAYAVNPPVTPITPPVTPPTVSPFKQAVQLDLTEGGDAIRLSRRLEIAGQRSFTVETYVKPTVPAAGLPVNIAVLAVKNPPASVMPAFQLQLQKYPSGGGYIYRPFFQIKPTNTNTIFIYPQLAVPDNAWTHLAATVDAQTGTVALYVNGTLAGSQTVNTPLNFSEASLGATLGAYRDPTGIYYFNLIGQLEETRISSVVRYTQDFTPPATPLVPDIYTLGLYRFDETLKDAGNFHNHGEVATGQPQYVPSTIIP